MIMTGFKLALGFALFSIAVPIVIYGGAFLVVFAVFAVNKLRGK